MTEVTPPPPRPTDVYGHLEFHEQFLSPRAVQREHATPEIPTIRNDFSTSISFGSIFSLPCMVFLRFHGSARTRCKEVTGDYELEERCFLLSSSIGI